MERRDNYALKVSRLRSVAKFSLLRGALSLRGQVQIARALSKRVRLLSTRKYFDKSGAGVTLSAAGFLRTAFRRIVKDVKTKNAAIGSSARKTRRSAAPRKLRLASATRGQSRFSYYPRAGFASKARSLLPLVRAIKSTQNTLNRSAVTNAQFQAQKPVTSAAPAWTSQYHD